MRRSRRMASPPSKKVVNLGLGLFLLCLGLLLPAVLPLHGPHFPWRRSIFLIALAMLAEALPVTGPRGRRISLSDGVGLASVLLLPPALAPLPSLLAGGMRGLIRQTVAAQRQTLRMTLERGVAVLLGSLAGSHFGPPGAIGVYALMRVGLRPWPQPARRRGLALEAAALAASAPAAFLMAALWPVNRLAGMGAAALMGLLLLAAHFAFETALLREQVRAMERMGAVTLAQDNLARVVERFLQTAGALASSHRMSLWMTDHSHFHLERVARLRAEWTETDGQRTQTLSPATTTVCFGEGWVGRVAERQVPMIVADSTRDQRVSEAERRDSPTEPFSALLLPLIVRGETLGVAQFERDDPHPYTPRDLSRVRALTNQATTAIVNALRHRAVTDQAVTDGLTGLFNRRHLQAALDSEERRALRYGHTLSAIMLDIDHFKSYNDTYGHTQGDVLIKKVAGLLRANVRAVDIVGRYGGEEFLVLMPETSKEEAALTAERLRQAVAGTAFPGFADDPEMVVLKTISLGVATLPEDAGDAAMLVTRADQSLYEAKRGGRNRVMVTEPLLETVQ